MSQTFQVNIPSCNAYINSDNRVDADRIQILELIGEGATAKVFTALLHREKLPGKEVAVKDYEWGSIGPCIREQEAFYREVATLKALQHPHLVRMLGMHSEKPLSIIMELCVGGNLFNLLHLEDVQVSCAQQMRISTDIAAAVDFMHSRSFVHRDLKSLNVLLHRRITGCDDLPIIKLADFGLARSIESTCNEVSRPTFGDVVQGRKKRLSSNVGTIQWMAPEIFIGQAYDTKVDIYSFGVVLHEIWSRVPPYEDVDSSAIKELVLRGGRPDMELLLDDTPEAVASLMVKCWARDPKARPDFSSVIQTLQTIPDFATNAMLA